MKKFDVNAITVKELIEELSQLDPDAKVVTTSDYGDYHHTTQVIGVDMVEELDSNSFCPTAYSQSGWKLISGEEEEDDGPYDERDEDVQPVVVLR